MNRRCLVGLLVLSVLLITATERVGLAADQTGRVTLIRIRGSNAMARMIDEWGREFSSRSPGENVIVAGGGTDAGFEALFDKAADLIMASRKVLVKEIQAAVLNDCKLKEVEVCRAAVAVITHPANPVKALTLQQLGKIFTGEISNWKDVGGPEGPITVYAGPSISGTAQYLRETVMGHEYFGSDVRVRDYYHHIIRDLARKQPPGLSYAPLLDAVNAQGKHMVAIMGIKKDQDAAAVYPNVGTIKDRSYPLMLPLYFYWNSDTADPAIGKFVEFCKKNCEIAK